MTRLITARTAMLGIHCSTADTVHCEINWVIIIIFDSL